MVKNIKGQKEAMKEKMSQRIDEYFAEFEKGSNEARFTIDDIERLMMDNQRKMRDMMSAATGELASGMDTDLKKMPKMRGNNEAHQERRKVGNKNHVR